MMQPSCACVTLAHSLSLLQISEGEHAHSLRLENAYAQPNINWTATQDYGKYIRHSKGGEESISQTYKYIDALHVQVGDGLVEYVPWLKAHSAQELEMEEQHVIVLLNRGSTQQLFRNHYLEARLSEMGLREDTAFGCAMEFLFRRAPRRACAAAMQAPARALIDLRSQADAHGCMRARRPLPEVAELMSREFGALSQSVSQAARLPPPCPRANATTSQPGGEEARMGRFLIRPRAEAPPKATPPPEEVDPARPKLVIGIHVRLPDNGASATRLQGDDTASQFDPSQYFACAQQIEDEHRCDGQDVVWCATGPPLWEAKADTLSIVHDALDMRGLLA